MPQSIFHLVTLVTYLGHFAKRVLEASFLHNYSKKLSLVPAIEVMIVFFLVLVVISVFSCFSCYVGLLFVQGKRKELPFFRNYKWYICIYPWLVVKFLLNVVLMNIPIILKPFLYPWVTVVQGGSGGAFTW